MVNGEPGFDAIVLAGGRGARMRDVATTPGVEQENVDKLSLQVGEMTLLDHALSAVAGAATTIVVGPRRPVSRSSAELSWTSEDPPGSGPASAIAHALGFVRRPIVAVLAGDVPFAATAIPRLLAALPGHAAAMLVDDDGRRQPLTAVYVTECLRARGSARDWANQPVRAMVETLDIAEVLADGVEVFDCDTPADLARAIQEVASP